MAKVQLKNGYTKIVNNLLEQFFIRDFSPIQLRILLMLIRFSYGCNKKTAKIKPQNLFNTAYVYECDIKRELKHLERNKVITCDYEEKVFSLNKNFDEWKVSFHKLFDEEKFSKLLHINLSCGQSKNFADNKEIEEAEEAETEETLFPSKKNLSCGQSKNFADNKEIEAGNADSESTSTLPKESIKKDKENNNTIYICNSKEIQTEEKTVKKDDPYTGKIQAKFCAIYKEVFGKPCYLNNAQRLALVEIKFENPDFEENLPVLIEKFSKIKFVFDGKVQKVGLRWLLEQGNWSGVLSGDFDNNIEDEKENDGWDL